MTLISRVERKIGRLRFGPKIQVTRTGSMIRLGSSYGGWTFSETSDLQGSTIFSCGLGEDASFDAEFAARFGAVVVIIDPTPRAIAHYQALLLRSGMRREVRYNNRGSQPPEAYELMNVKPDQFVLIPKAITDSIGTVRFYAPTNPQDVSHSIVNFQNDYSTTTPFIEVESITFAQALTHVGISSVALAKFDIEGAEISVIPQMMREGIRPTQILVEFDELNRPSQRARANFKEVHELLLASGYTPIHFDNRSCVSYLLEAHP